MTEVDLFRQYARGDVFVLKTTDENEKRALIGFARVLAQAALTSERTSGSSFVSSPCDIAETTSPS